jgi:hypothetical protein
MDPREMETQIRHTSDSDLFAALDLSRQGLAAVRAAVEAEDHPAAYRAWADCRAARDGITLVPIGDPEVDEELLPAAEVEAWLRADPPRVESWIRRAEPVMRHEITGWGDVTHQHGEVVDFDFDYGWNGKYGFHYWFWAQPLLMAYHATGGTGYLAEFDRPFGQWHEQRDAVPDRIIWDGLGLAWVWAVNAK